MSSLVYESKLNLGENSDIRRRACAVVKAPQAVSTSSNDGIAPRFPGDGDLILFPRLLNPFSATSRTLLSYRIRIVRFLTSLSFSIRKR